MNTTMAKNDSSKQPPEPPGAVMYRLADLLPPDALDEAVKGLKPEDLSGAGGLLSQLAGRVI